MGKKRERERKSEEEFYYVPWNEIPCGSARQETRRKKVQLAKKTKKVDVNVNILPGCNLKKKKETKGGREKRKREREIEKEKGGD